MVSISVLLVFLPVISVITSNPCNFTYKLEHAGIIHLKSPNFPEPDGPGTECQWTVEAPVEVPIVVTCPFPKEPLLYTVSDEPQELPCDGEFTIWPEGENNPRLCHGQPFSQEINGTKMILTYKVTANWDVGVFACYVHYRENRTAPDPIDFGNCASDIHVKWGEVFELTSFHFPWWHPAGKNCRWNIISPPDSRIRLHCPFRDLPTDPTERPVCSYLSIYRAGIIDETEQKFHCQNNPDNIIESFDNQMIVTFTNTTEWVEPFRCKVTAICDRKLFLDYEFYKDRRMELKSPRHPNLLEKKAICRWTIESTPGTRILMTKPGGYYIKEGENCPGWFRIYPDARIPLNFNPIINLCMEAQIQEFSYSNKMVIEFNFTEPDYAHQPFEFFLTVDKLPELDKDPETSIEANVDETTELPCDISHDTTYPTEVQWYREDSDNPVYTLDARVKALFHADQWTDFGVFRNRASLRVTEEIANLVIQRVEIEDAGKYKCRVHFYRAQTRNSNVILTVKPEPSPFRQCDRIIPVNFGEKGFLKSLNHSGLHPPGSNCRWRVKSPSNSYIELSCPRLYQEDTDLDPCKHFSVYTQGTMNSTSTLMECRNEENKVNSVGNAMIVTFTDSMLDIPAFACNLTVICNHAKRFYSFGRGYVMKSPGHPLMIPPKASCRWTLNSPANSRFVITCPNDNIPQEDTCPGWFTFSIDGDTQSNSTKYCHNEGFAHISDTHELVVEYSNSDMTKSKPFNCHVIVEFKEPGFGDEECSCGKRNKIGGETEVNEFPMLAGIIRPDEIVPFCSATIISSKHALTAASCMKDINVDEVDLIVGGRKREAIANNDPNMVRHKIIGIFNNENWNGDRLSGSDVSIVTVDAIEFSQNVGPACLPFRNIKNSLAGQNATALGWGPMEQAKVLILHHLEFKSWEPFDYWNVNRTMFCTFSYNQKTCSAKDAGGPILWFDPVAFQWKLVGIQPGEWCKEGAESRVATRVSEFLTWIEEAAQGVTLCKR